MSVCSRKYYSLAPLHTNINSLGNPGTANDLGMMFFCGDIIVEHVDVYFVVRVVNDEWHYLIEDLQTQNEVCFVIFWNKNYYD